MDGHLLHVFQSQVKLQCEAIMFSAGHLSSARENAAKPQTPQAAVTSNTWIAIQNLLNAAANVSKTMWGQGGKLAAQREPLRVSLQTTDESPFRDVAMRNHFEHFDERLDRWWAESESRNYFDLSVMSIESVVGADQRDMFRVLDPQTLDIVFWGERFSVLAIIREAQRVLAVARDQLEKPAWEK